MANVYRSGCCVNMRDATCYQTSRLFCSRSTSTWLHYSENHGPLVAEALFNPQMEGLISQPDFVNFGSTTRPSIGPVCGLDPEFCADPRSTGPFTWSSTDVTEWPVRVEMCTYWIHMRSLFINRFVQCPKMLLFSYLWMLFNALEPCEIVPPEMFFLVFLKLLLMPLILVFETL